MSKKVLRIKKILGSCGSLRTTVHRLDYKNKRSAGLSKIYFVPTSAQRLIVIHIYATGRHFEEKKIVLLIVRKLYKVCCCASLPAGGCVLCLTVTEIIMFDHFIEIKTIFLAGSLVILYPRNEINKSSRT